jgi:carboxymethylenebutenolidase
MRITLASGTPAELALPAGEATRGVVLFPDIYGLRPLFDALAAQLASDHGWAVCVVELFPGQELADIDARFAAVPTLIDDGVLADAAQALAAITDAAPAARVAVMGFCLGGMYAEKAAASGWFDRAVSFYGMIRLPAAFKGQWQGEPLIALAKGSPTPLLAVIGDKDPYTPPEDVAELEALGERISVVHYPDAEHGFVHDPGRPAHRPGDAADAWGRVATFLA